MTPPRTVTLHDPTAGRDVAVGRVVGRYGGDRPGPLLVAVAGVHGNEPSGVLALRAVFERLARHRPPIAGAFVGLTGNLAALARRQRFVDEDLNRVFLDEVIARAHRPPAEARAFNTAEESELADLMDALHRAEADAPDPGGKFFLDCHTTSAESDPWASLHDHAPSERWAEGFPVHAVTGLEMAMRGTMAQHLHARGWVGFTFEAGQHDDLSSVEAQQACLWLALARAGCLADADVPDFDHWHGLLAKSTAVEGRRAFGVVDCFRVRPGEAFVMEPGFVNFQPVERGRLMARSGGAEVRAKLGGRVLMPLYQKQGDDGFFLVQEHPARD